MATSYLYGAGFEEAKIKFHTIQSVYVSCKKKQALGFHHQMISAAKQSSSSLILTPSYVCCVCIVPSIDMGPTADTCVHYLLSILYLLTFIAELVHDEQQQNRPNQAFHNVQ